MILASRGARGGLVSSVSHHDVDRFFPIQAIGFSTAGKMPIPSVPTL
jgi:hypothetical protein